jgi:hypothetical protein
VPEFTNPFSGIVSQCKLADSELVRALCLDLAVEEEVVRIYEPHTDAIDSKLAKKCCEISQTRSGAIPANFNVF